MFVTNQLQFLPKADRVVMIDQGQILEMGTFRQLMAAGKDFSKLMTEFGMVEEDLSAKDSDLVARLSVIHLASKHSIIFKGRALSSCLFNGFISNDQISAKPKVAIFESSLLDSIAAGKALPTEQSQGSLYKSVLGPDRTKSSRLLRGIGKRNLDTLAEDEARAKIELEKLKHGALTLKEKRESGNVSAQVYNDYIKFGGVWILCAS